MLDISLRSQCILYNDYVFILVIFLVVLINRVMLRSVTT